MRPLLPDILAPGLDVIFVGAAPSLKAATTGHYYPGPRNRFWQLLYQAGFTPRQLRPEEDSSVLAYGIGLTAVFPHLISVDNTLLPAPTDEERARLRAKFLHYAPRLICYNGRDVYRLCHGEDAPRWGLQPRCLGVSEQFVVHSTSGRADRWGAERLFLFRSLRDFIESLPR